MIDPFTLAQTHPSLETHTPVQTHTMLEKTFILRLAVIVVDFDFYERKKLPFHCLCQPVKRRKEVCSRIAQ